MHELQRPSEYIVQRNGSLQTQKQLEFTFVAHLSWPHRVRWKANHLACPPPLACLSHMDSVFLVNQVSLSALATLPRCTLLVFTSFFSSFSEPCYNHSTYTAPFMEHYVTRVMRLGLPNNAAMAHSCARQEKGWRYAGLIDSESTSCLTAPGPAHAHLAGFPLKRCQRSALLCADPGMLEWAEWPGWITCTCAVADLAEVCRGHGATDKPSQAGHFAALHQVLESAFVRACLVTTFAPYI